jgi:hypothetical protein
VVSQTETAVAAEACVALKAIRPPEMTAVVTAAARILLRVGIGPLRG